GRGGAPGARGRLRRQSPAAGRRGSGPRAAGSTSCAAFDRHVAGTGGIPSGEVADVAATEWQFLDHTFRIGEESGPVIRQGLNFDTAQKTAEIIRDIAGVDAVAITDRETVLGYAGVGCPYMVQGQPIITEATRRAL